MRAAAGGAEAVAARSRLAGAGDGAARSAVRAVSRGDFARSTRRAAARTDLAAVGVGCARLLEEGQSSASVHRPQSLLLAHSAPSQSPVLLSSKLPVLHPPSQKPPPAGNRSRRAATLIVRTTITEPEIAGPRRDLRFSRRTEAALAARLLVFGCAGLAVLLAADAVALGANVIRAARVEACRRLSFSSLPTQMPGHSVSRTHGSPARSRARALPWRAPDCRWSHRSPKPIEDEGGCLARLLDGVLRRLEQPSADALSVLVARHAVGDRRQARRCVSDPHTSATMCSFACSNFAAWSAMTSACRLRCACALRSAPSAAHQPRTPTHARSTAPHVVAHIGLLPLSAPQPRRRARDARLAGAMTSHCIVGRCTAPCFVSRTPSPTVTTIAAHEIAH